MMQGAPAPCAIAIDSMGVEGDAPLSETLKNKVFVGELEGGGLALPRIVLLPRIIKAHSNGEADSCG